MSKILITGGNGLIGNRVAFDLSKEHKVVLMDLVKNNDFDSLVFDVTEKDWIDSVGKFDYVFHFASIGGGTYNTGNPVNVIHTELTGLFNVLNYSLQNNVKKVIYSSTGLVSEKFKNWLNFSKIPLNHYLSYPTAKLMGEYFIKEFHKENNTGYIIVRYYNVYGENQSDEMVIPFFLRNVIQGSPLVIFGDGKQKRDFTYVGDVSKATIASAFSENTFSRTVNIGTGVQTSIKDLAKLVKKLTNSKSEIIKDNFPSGLEELEQERSPFSASYLQELIGLTCKTSLEEGLKKVISSIEGK